jgi:RNA polymerase sigma factor for flagellar operon FliA
VTRRTERATSESVQKLWEQYHNSGDAGLRDRLVLTLAPMVKYIVYRKVREIPARCEVEDFISCGLEALMRSIDRYDPERGATRRASPQRLGAAFAAPLGARHLEGPRTLHRALRPRAKSRGAGHVR